MKTCPNCEAPLPEGARFCPSCGQSLRDFSRPWTTVIRELLDELFDLDGRMMVSLHHLLLRPGYLSQEYNRGRRRSFTPPLRLYLVISVLFFLVLPSIIPPAPGQLDSHRVSVDLYSKGLFVLLPVFALLLKAFYRDAFYLAHLVFTLYLFSFLFIVFGLLMATETWADRYLAVLVLQLLLFGWLLYYFVAALRANFGGGWGRSALKGLGLLLIFTPLLAATIETASHLEQGWKT